ncbi:MAG: MATE family efflux transporter [Cyclobacteriaceae bacterium]
MTLREHLKKHVTLATPVVVGQLGHIMVSVADTAMVGRIGVIPLAGATFAGTIYHVMLLFGIGVSYAITPLVAASDPKDEEKHVHYLQNAFFLNLMLGILFYLLMLVSLPLLPFMGQEKQVVAAAGPFLLIVGSSMIPLMVFQTFRQYAEGLSNTLLPMVVSIIANVLNIALNYVLIFGKWGAPEMGLNGAGYATLISRVVMAAMIWLAIKNVSFKVKINFQTIRRMIRLGIPSGLQYVFEVGAFAISTIMMGWIGAEAIAAHQIALNLSAISYMAATGIAAASTIRVGNQLGAQDLHNLRLAGWTGVGLVTAFMTSTAIVFLLFRFQLAGLYIREAYVQSLAASLLIIAGAFQISDGVQAVGLGMLRGLTDVKVPTLVTFVAYWLIAIPLGYVLAFIVGWGAQGIWIALLIGLSLAAIMHMIRFSGKIRKISF